MSILAGAVFTPLPASGRPTCWPCLAFASCRAALSPGPVFLGPHTVVPGTRTVIADREPAVYTEWQPMSAYNGALNYLYADDVS